MPRACTASNGPVLITMSGRLDRTSDSALLPRCSPELAEWATPPTEAKGPHDHPTKYPSRPAELASVLDGPTR